jgi:hypothetical protein
MLLDVVIIALSSYMLPWDDPLSLSFRGPRLFEPLVMHKLSTSLIDLLLDDVGKYKESLVITLRRITEHEEGPDPARCPHRPCCNTKRFFQEVETTQDAPTGPLPLPTLAVIPLRLGKYPSGEPAPKKQHLADVKEEGSDDEEEGSDDEEEESDDEEEDPAAAEEEAASTVSDIELPTNADLAAETAQNWFKDHACYLAEALPHFDFPVGLVSTSILDRMQGAHAIADYLRKLTVCLDTASEQNLDYGVKALILKFTKTLGEWHARVVHGSLLGSLDVEAQDTLLQLSTFNGSRKTFKEERSPPRDDKRWTQGTNGNNKSRTYRVLMPLNCVIDIFKHANVRFYLNSGGIACHYTEMANRSAYHLTASGRTLLSRTGRVTPAPLNTNVLIIFA